MDMTKRELVIAAFEAMRDDYPALTTTLGTVEKTLDVLCGVAAAELLGGGKCRCRASAGSRRKPLPPGRAGIPEPASLWTFRRERRCALWPAKN